MYFLDTHFISELRKAKSGKADKNVVAWAVHGILPLTAMHIPALRNAA